MFEYDLNLLASHALEPFEKLAYSCPTLNVLKKSANRHARPLEQPLTAHLAGYSLHG